MLLIPALATVPRWFTSLKSVLTDASNFSFVQMIAILFPIWVSLHVSYSNLLHSYALITNHEVNWCTSQLLSFLLGLNIPLALCFQILAIHFLSHSVRTHFTKLSFVVIRPKRWQAKPFFTSQSSASIKFVPSGCLSLGTKQFENASHVHEIWY
jgi:hypothetical protein